MPVSETKIYKELQKRNNSFFIEQINLLNAIIKPVLEIIPSKFSNYTKHDIEHSVRVADYMVDLLPADMSEYSSTELQLMLYSAMLHDIGMAVGKTEGELSSIDQDDIRNVHHERSKDYILKIINFDFKVDYESRNNLKNFVANIAKSHGEDGNWIDNNLQKETEIGYDEINPAFIACLLRISDYLDFDSRRTPESLFSFLNLEKVSLQEWEKHFPITNFNKVKKTDGKKVLYFEGECFSPDIYRAILDYFRKIEKEISNIKSIEFNNKKYCFTLDDKIINKIQKKGFDAVDLQYSIDYLTVSRLLIGENLYSNKRIALREILQNSIDACNVKREIFSKNSNEYFPKITICIADNYVSICDNGIGMDLNVIKSYFLSIGNSYYQSSEFKKSQLSYIPISHYGIGFLSTFLLSESVTVKTTSYKESNMNYLLAMNKNSQFIMLKKEKKEIITSGTEIVLNKDSFFSVFDNEISIIDYIRSTFRHVGFPIVINGKIRNELVINDKKDSNVELSNYLRDVDCKCKLLKGIIPTVFFRSVLMPLESSLEYIYDSEMFPERIVSCDDIIAYNEKSTKKYTLFDLLDKTKLICYKIYPLDCDSSSYYEESLEVLKDEKKAFEETEKEFYLYEPYIVYSNNHELRQVFSEIECIQIYDSYNLKTEEGKFLNIIKTFLETEDEEIESFIIEKDEKDVFINQSLFVFTNTKQIKSMEKNTLAIHNVYINSFNITNILVLNGVFPFQFDINMYGKEDYPSVSRENIKEEDSIMLAQAIGRGFYMYVLEHYNNLQDEERNLVKEFILLHYPYNSNNRFMKE